MNLIFEMYVWDKVYETIMESYGVSLKKEEGMFLTNCDDYGIFRRF